MFPHTITIYRHTIEGNVDCYTKQIVSGVYWNEQRGIDKNGNGQVNGRQVNIVTNKALCDSYGQAWSCQSNDRVILGVGNDIEKLADIPNAYIVNSVTVNKAECDLDNIVIVGV